MLEDAEFQSLQVGSTESLTLPHLANHGDGPKGGNTPVPLRETTKVLLYEEEVGSQLEAQRR